MKHLLIIGARGWGREVYAAAIGTKAYHEGEYDVKGFLDSKADAFDGLKGNFPPIICAPEDYEIQPDDVFFVAMGDPKWRKYYAEMMKAKGAEFISIICDGAYVNPTAMVGRGVFISCWSCVSDNVKIGSHAMIHAFTDLGHDCCIGEYASIESYVFIGGHCNIGEMSIMHPKSMLIADKNIGKEVVVGAGSVVMRNIRDGWHVHGNPAIRMEY